MSIRDDPPARCVMCAGRIGGEEVWLWDRLPYEMHIGPMHEGCAAECEVDDPTRWSRTEPEEAPDV